MLPLDRTFGRTVVEQANEFVAHVTTGNGKHRRRDLMIELPQPSGAHGPQYETVSRILVRQQGHIEPPKRESTPELQQGAESSRQGAAKQRHFIHDDDLVDSFEQFDEGRDT